MWLVSVCGVCVCACIGEANDQKCSDKGVRENQKKHKKKKNKKISVYIFAITLQAQNTTRKRNLNLNPIRISNP